MFVKIHVYNDGDVELTKLAAPCPLTEDLSFDVRGGHTNVLRAELIGYGHDEDRVDEAIKNVMAAEEHDPIIL